MLTRIEIDGFKSFTNFSMEFSPLTIIAGLNASGKSNLFDALHLLSLLAEHDLNTAFDKVQRGRNLELFTQYADGRYAEEMRFAVELLMDQGLKEYKSFEGIDSQRIRYEVSIKRQAGPNDVEEIIISEDTLGLILLTPPDAAQVFEPVVFADINSFVEWNGRAMMLRKNQPNSKRVTILGMMSRLKSEGDPGFLLPIQEEMGSWKLLHLDPQKLPAATPAQAFGLPGTLNALADNLAGVFWRLSKTDPYLLTRIAQRLAALVPGIKEIVVRHDDYYNQYRVFVHTTAGQRFPLHLLSEGTLRLLALCTLAFDDQQHGVLGLEEPENGVHPGLLKRVAEMLFDLSNNAQDEGEEPWPLRQVIVNTHSPGLIKACLEAAAGQEGGRGKLGLTVWFSQLVSRGVEENGQRVSRRVTKMLPVDLTPGAAKVPDPEKRIALAQLVSFLESANPDDLLDSLGLQAIAAAL